MIYEATILYTIVIMIRCMLSSLSLADSPSHNLKVTAYK